VKLRRSIIADRTYRETEKQQVVYKFSSDGKVIEMQHPHYLNGQMPITTFGYNDSGRLTSMKGSLIKGSPNSGLKGLVKPIDYENAIKAIPAVAEITFTLQFNKDTIVGIKKYNSNGGLLSETIFSKDGLEKLSNESGKGYQLSSTIFYTKNAVYPLLPVLVAKGPGKSKDETKFEYQFDASGKITDITEYYKSQYEINNKWSEMKKYTLVYNKNGLLRELKYGLGSYLFEYEYY
jgi:hypothetical protein